jgi:CheY-like chemotaxis protein
MATSDLSTILLVEDDMDDATITQQALRRVGITNTITHLMDGEEAINYLGGQPPFQDRAKHPLPALILLDLKMPKYSGFEVLAWLHSNPDLLRIPVIILTGSIHPADRQRATELGAVAYEVKPVDSAELVAMAQNIRQHIPQGRRPAP